MRQDTDMRIPLQRHRRKRRTILALSFTLSIALVAGLLGGFLFLSLPGINADHPTNSQFAALAAEVNPPEGYTLPVTYAHVGPQLLTEGAIDLDRFAQVYRQSGQPLTEDQQAILKEGSAGNVFINSQNAYFLLNFFWAVGLVSANPVLTEGEMVAQGKDQIGNFASTGGWTLGDRSAIELYASAALIPLTQVQQSRLETVAAAVYRPCCNNSTHFPDCNHGMAMLGLLELMASQNANEDQMFMAAKHVNAYWFPQQMQEIALYFKVHEKVNFTDADARQIVGRENSSSSGFQQVHSWLAGKGLLPRAPSTGNNCGV